MSVRLRVTAVATVIVIAVLGAVSVGLVAAQERLMTARLEDSLNGRADDITALVEGPGVPPVLGGRADDDIVTQVVSDSGVIVAASRGAGRGVMAPAPDGREALRTLRTPLDDDDFRVLSRRVDGVVVHVGGALDDVTESAALLGRTLAVAVPVVAALLAALVWWLVGRTLRPVEAIRAEASTIGGPDLARRVPEPSGDDEVARLARTMNAMLNRIEEAYRRQERFVADASHELRTPLARMRAELEVDLAHRSSADFEATHRSVLEELDRLQVLVEDLLHLARGEADTPVPVDLGVVVRRVTSQTPVDVSAVGEATVIGDERQLRRVVANLLDNATRYGSQVAVSVAQTDGVATLAVTDDGPGIPPDAQARVFDRFVRLDEARGRADGGAGLGLAIARDIVERHDGSIAIDPDYDAGTRVVVTLPAASTG